MVGLMKPTGDWPLCGQLLVDESDVAGPHGRGEAGAAVVVRQAGGLVGAGVEGEVGVGRDVGAVAQGRRALVARS